MIPKDLLYTEEHEWVRVEGGTATVGITHHAQDMLGDVTFVELPAVGMAVDRGGEVCAVESAKAAASVYAPTDGKIIAVNQAVEDDPGLVNAEPYGEGWVYQMEMSDPAQTGRLLNAAQYSEFLESESH